MDRLVDVRGLVKSFDSTRALDGRDPWRDAVELHRRICYVPSDTVLWPNLTGGEVIDLIGRLQGGVDRGRRDELVERFDLDPRKKSRTYSKGNRQKVALVAALASDAELLVMDEPTAGLDSLMESIFQQCVREVRDAGRTVLLLYGAWPRVVVASWAGLAIATVITFFAEPLQLPSWARDLSPFSHLPELPAADLSLGAPLVVLLVAGALGAAGLAALRRRDLATG